MTNAEVRRALMGYVAAKLFAGIGCDAGDFASPANRTRLAPDDHPRFLSVACFSAAAVALAKRPIYDKIERSLLGKPGFRCLDVAQIAEYARILAPHGRSLWGGQGFVPDMGAGFAAPEIDYPIRAVRHADLIGLIDPADWHMCRPSAESARILAAIYRDRAVGLASADAEGGPLYSIDVEVLPDHRGRGIARALTAALTAGILRAGGIPFATGAWTNNASRATLCRCGYYPAWSSMESFELPEDADDFEGAIGRP